MQSSPTPPLGLSFPQLPPKVLRHRSQACLDFCCDRVDCHQLCGKRSINDTVRGVFKLGVDWPSCIHWDGLASWSYPPKKWYFKAPSSTFYFGWIPNPWNSKCPVELFARNLSQSSSFLQGLDLTSKKGAIIDINLRLKWQVLPGSKQLWIRCHLDAAHAEWRRPPEMWKDENFRVAPDQVPQVENPCGP